MTHNTHTANADLPLAELTLDELRPVLVDAMLQHVPFDGWTNKAVDAAAADIGLNKAVARLVFPGGATEMVDAMTARADSRMAEALDNAEFRGSKVREKITQAIRTRLEQAAPHREAVRRAVELLAFPLNAPLAARLTWRTSDAIWRAAGDSSTDFNHYSKRAIAGGVYAATLLYWLADDSEDFADTWAFLNRRIENVMRIETAKMRLKGKRGEDKFSLTRLLGRLRYPVES